MTVFDECPRCGHKSEFFSTASLYECKICGEVFCSTCRMKSDGLCPNCDSDRQNHLKLGILDDK
jgi:hypothetical protein